MVAMFLFYFLQTDNFNKCCVFFLRSLTIHTGSRGLQKIKNYSTGLASNSIIFLSRSNFGHGYTCRRVKLLFPVLYFCVSRGIYFVLTKRRIYPSIFPQISSQNIRNGFRLNSALSPAVFIGQSKPLLFTKLHWNIMNYLKNSLLENVRGLIFYQIFYIFYVSLDFPLLCTLFQYD